MRISRLLPLIGIALFLAIVSRLDMALLLSALARIDPAIVLVEVLLTLPDIMIKAFKWTLIIKSYNLKYPIGAAAKAWLVGFFIGTLTPGRVGDLCRALYLKKDAGVSTGRSLTTVIVDRVIEVATLFFMAAAGLILIASPAHDTGQVFLTVAAAFAAFAAAVSFALRKGMMESLLKPVFSRFAPRDYRHLLREVFDDFYSGMRQMSKFNMSISFALSVAGWVIIIIQYWLISAALGLSIPLVFLFGTIPVVMILDVLPVSFSGIGTREASLIFFFSLAAASPESAVSVSLMIFLLNYVLPALLGLFFWSRNPVNLEAARARR